MKYSAPHSEQAPRRTSGAAKGGAPGKTMRSLEDIGNGAKTTDPLSSGKAFTNAGGCRQAMATPGSGRINRLSFHWGRLDRRSRPKGREATHVSGASAALKKIPRRLEPPTYPGELFPACAVIQPVPVHAQHLNSVDRDDADVSCLYAVFAGRQLDWAPTAPIPEYLLPTGCR
jgi:hypothetical protein